MLSTDTVTSPAAPQRQRRLAGRIAALSIMALGVGALFPGVSSAAQEPVGLRTADPFAVLAGEGITNANATTITGDVGTYANPAETGFDSVTLTGTNHYGDDVTAQAKVDLVTAYDEAAGAGPPTLVEVELGGTTLKPGVYNGPTLEITGVLTLDTEGDPNAVFIFQSGSTLLTAAGSSVIVLNGGTACNVFWKVPSSATLGTDSHLIGTVLASTSIQATSGATIEGRLLAQTASVTLDHNTITRPICADTGTTTTTEGGGGPTTTTPGEGGASTTTPGGLTSDTPGDSTRFTPGESTSDTPGSPNTPPTVARPPLARTGFDSGLPLLGTALIGFGVLLVRLSKTRITV